MSEIKLHFESDSKTLDQNCNIWNPWNPIYEFNLFSYASSSTLHSCEPVSQSAGGQSFGLERSLELASLLIPDLSLSGDLSRAASPGTNLNRKISQAEPPKFYETIFFNDQSWDYYIQEFFLVKIYYEVKICIGSI